MKKIRITINHNQSDPTDDLRIAASIRRDLWAHSPVEVDPDGRVHGTHRDAASNAYFEFVTNYPEEASRVLNEYGYSDRAAVAIVDDEAGPECASCGNIAGPILPTVCPTCHFRDIGPCPYCGEEVPRQKYIQIAGDLFRCPNPECEHRVRLRFQDPIFDSRGHYIQPLVVVDRVEQITHAL
jgi:hypothetical protein